MTWGSLNEFLAMGGHGFFVWGAYGMAVLCIVVEVLVLKLRK
jgi:heme exporter protein D